MDFQIKKKNGRETVRKESQIIDDRCIDGQMIDFNKLGLNKINL